ncbi:Mitochondrial inner membrane magnesium transporter MRS2 [Colletotrichum siamense]|nr:Mitochondrial inner membrane magnesium transporter MRS2 [Colletotrichum siamense]
MAMRLIRHSYRICFTAHQLTVRSITTKASAPTTVSTPSAIPCQPKRLRCTEVDENGDVTVRYISAKKTELTTRYGLVPRDIRKIELSTLSHIGIRPSTVLIHLFHLKVLVQHDRALIFDDATSPTSREAFLRDIGEAIKQRNAALAEVACERKEDETYAQPQATFEFLALEAVLSSVVTELEGELAAVRLPADRVLASLEDDVDRRVLLNLFGLSGRATWVAAQAELVLGAVEDVLDWDDSLAALYLTEKADPNALAKTVDDDLTAAESLLGSYYNALNEIVQEAQSLVSSIRNTQESASAILDANRNSLMLLDLKYRMGTLGLASGSFFSAFYGMNISNYIVDYNWAFPGVCGTSAVLAVIATCYGSSVLRKLMRVRMEGHREARSLVSGKWSKTMK